MKHKFYAVYIRNDLTVNTVTEPLGPFLSVSNIGGAESLTLNCNRIDLSHFKYAELSAQFGDTDKFINIHLPHEYIFMILSAAERQDLNFGFAPAENSDDQCNQ